MPRRKPSERRIIWVSQQEFADYIGVGRTTVLDALHRGRISKGENGKLDLLLCYRAWIENKDGRKDKVSEPGGIAGAIQSGVRSGRPESQGAAPERLSDECGVAGAEGELVFVGFPEAQRRRELATAKLKELEVAEREGTLVDKAVANRTVYRFCRTVRDELLHLPGRVAPEQGATLTGYVEDILRDALPADKVQGVLEQIEAGAIEVITRNAWEREARTVLENVAEGESELL
jgi:hypothetical protein